jgi:hypothetical protein
MSGESSSSYTQEVVGILVTWPICIGKLQPASVYAWVWCLSYVSALFDLTMKDVGFIWGLPQEDSFMKLKELITSAPVLILPNNDLPFRLEADNSGITTSAVLSQQQVDNNAWHPVAFLSKALNPVEQNYKIHDTEMLAIIRGLEEWRHYLEGARHSVEIWTDHKNLEYF